MLHQLAEHEDHTEQKNLYLCRLQDLTGIMADNPLRREQFYEWKPKYEKLAKTKYLTNEENPDFDDETKFNIWLRGFCEKPPEEEQINLHWTHQQIWKLLYDAKNKNFISAQSIGDLLHYREVLYDMFLICDQDHDNKLRKYVVDEQLRWHDGDFDEEFWDILEDSIPDISSYPSAK